MRQALGTLTARQHPRHRSWAALWVSFLSKSWRCICILGLLLEVRYLEEFRRSSKWGGESTPSATKSTTSESGAGTGTGTKPKTRTRTQGVEETSASRSSAGKVLEDFQTDLHLQKVTAARLAMEKQTVEAISETKMGEMAESEKSEIDEEQHHDPLTITTSKDQSDAISKRYTPFFLVSDTEQQKVENKNTPPTPTESVTTSNTTDVSMSEPKNFVTGEENIALTENKDNEGPEKSESNTTANTTVVTISNVTTAWTQNETVVEKKLDIPGLMKSEGKEDSSVEKKEDHAMSDATTERIDKEAEIVSKEGKAKEQEEAIAQKEDHEKPARTDNTPTTNTTAVLISNTTTELTENEAVVETRKERRKRRKERKENDKGENNTAILGKSVSTSSNSSNAALASQMMRPAICMGPGTTATRIFHDALCDLGYQAVHFRDTCAKTKMLKKTQFGKTLYWPMFIWKSAVNCLLEHKCYRENQPPLNDAQKFLDDMKDAFRKAVRVGKKHNVLFYLDLPYPNYADLAMDVFEEELGQKPYTFLTKRDGIKWALSRLIHHRGTLCLDNYDRIDEEGCIRRALARQTNASEPVNLRDVFFSVPPINLVKDARTNETRVEPKLIRDIGGRIHNVDEIIKGMAKGMERHVQKHENSSFFSIDVFSYEKRLSLQDISQKLKDHLPADFPAPDHKWKQK